MRTVSGFLAAMLVGGLAWAGEVRPDQSRHLIYLHGKIVQEQQTLRPQHPEYGYYEMAEITAAFRDRGFIVTSDMRAKQTSVSEAADGVVEQVRRLLNAGVPADHITVVGASMGAAIALRASARLGNPGVRFAVLGPCLSLNVPAINSEEGASPRGHLFAVREESDIASADCPAWTEEDDRTDGLFAREVVIDTGLGHGFLYRPMPEWLDPVVDWAVGSQ